MRYFLTSLIAAFLAVFGISGLLESCSPTKTTIRYGNSSVNLDSGKVNINLPDTIKVK